MSLQPAPQWINGPLLFELYLLFVIWLLLIYGVFDLVMLKVDEESLLLFEDKQKPKTDENISMANRIKRLVESTNGLDIVGVFILGSAISHHLTCLETPNML